jgi:hypothetical protein
MLRLPTSSFSQSLHVLDRGRPDHHLPTIRSYPISEQLLSVPFPALFRTSLFATLHHELILSFGCDSKIWDQVP